jgi:hypothetical protein
MRACACVVCRGCSALGAGKPSRATWGLMRRSGRYGTLLFHRHAGEGDGGRGGGGGAAPVRCPLLTPLLQHGYTLARHPKTTGWGQARPYALCVIVGGLSLLHASSGRVGLAGGLCLAVRGCVPLQKYDATELVKAYKGPDLHILVDQVPSSGALVLQGSCGCASVHCPCVLHRRPRPLPVPPGFVALPLLGSVSRRVLLIRSTRAGNSYQKTFR